MKFTYHQRLFGYQNISMHLHGIVAISILLVELQSIGHMEES